MLDKAEAAAQLAENDFPLYTSEIRHSLVLISRPGPLSLALSDILCLVSKHEDHFADLISEKTQGHTTVGTTAWVSPTTGHEFHDIDIEVVQNYLLEALRREEHFEQLPHKTFVVLHEALLEKKRECDSREAVLQDLDRFFSLPAARATPASWAHWMKLPYLKTEEASALALGLDPEIVTLEKVSHAVGNGKSAFLEHFIRTIRLFDRQGSWKGQSTGQISSFAFRRLVKEEMIQYNESTSHIFFDAKHNGPTKGIENSAQATHSLYKIVFALLCKQYPEVSIGMPPEAERSAFYSKMEADLAVFIKGTNRHNIKKYIERAHAFVTEKELLLPLEKTTSLENSE